MDDQGKTDNTYQYVNDMINFVKEATSEEFTALNTLLDTASGLELSFIQEQSLTQQLQEEYDLAVTAKTSEAYATGVIAGSNAEKRSAELSAFLMETKVSYENRITEQKRKEAEAKVKVKIAWARLDVYKSILSYRSTIIQTVD